MEEALQRARGISSKNTEIWRLGCGQLPPNRAALSPTSSNACRRYCDSSSYKLPCDSSSYYSTNYLPFILISTPLDSLLQLLGAHWLHNLKGFWSSSSSFFNRNQNSINTSIPPHFKVNQLLFSFNLRYLCKLLQSLSKVSKFSMKHPSFELICNFMTKLYFDRDYSSGLLDPKNTIIRLLVKADYSRLLSRHSYYICGFSMHALKWSPHTY